jgi:hypothetical protein
MPATAFETQCSEREIQIIMYHNNIINFIEIFNGKDRATGEIHKGSGFEKKVLTHFKQLPFKGAL